MNSKETISFPLCEEDYTANTISATYAAIKQTLPAYDFACPDIGWEDEIGKKAEKYLHTLISEFNKAQSHLLPALEKLKNAIDSCNRDRNGNECMRYQFIE